MNFSRARRVDPVVDVTPLIDIIFQLVLFFMVSTTFVSAPGIEVDLPRYSIPADPSPDAGRRQLAESTPWGIRKVYEGQGEGQGESQGQGGR